MQTKVKMLVAVGAAVSANCQPCLETAVSHAQETGAENKEILEAIAIGKIVSKGARGKMDKFASQLIGKDTSANSENECECIATDEEVKEWVDKDQ